MNFYSKGFSDSDSEPKEGKIKDKPKAVKKVLNVCNAEHCTEFTITIMPFLFQVGKINEFAVGFSCIFEGEGGRARQIHIELKHAPFASPI